MGEQENTKCKQWTIRLTIEDGDHDSITWDAVGLTAVVMKMLASTPELVMRRISRLEVENCGY